MILMHNWVKNKNYSLIIFYFNHKLRKDSDDELKFVKNLSKDFNIKFKSFNWLGTKPSSAIMKLARDVRYKTIFDYCKKNHIIHLMTAHHLDDLIETFFMRLQRKFSTIGLRSISKKFCNNDLVLYRPLLKFKKKRLVLTCKYHDLKWVEDKSNKDIQYERVRVRNYLKENPQQNLKLEKDLKSKIYQNNELEKKNRNFFF